jgi:hypothetical protein
VLIVTARIVDEECFCVMKEENSAQHIFSTLVSDELRVASRVSDLNTKMVVCATDIIGNSRLRAGKHKNP